MHASPSEHPRVGIVVPRHGQTAVLRNRLKRRLRELVRLRMLRELPAVDVVIRARREAYDVAFAALRDEVDQIRARILQRHSG